MTLNHHREGSGEPLVLIHGTSSQWQVWRPLFERLAPERDVIALDLPGFGESPPLPADVEPTPYALTDAVAEFLDELGIERPAVAGNSLGGWVALELARRRRGRAVGALAPAGFWTPRERAYCVATMRLDTAIARAAMPGAAAIVRNPVGRTVAFSGLVGRPWRIPGDDAVGMVENMARSPDFERIVDAYSRLTFRAGEEIDVPVTLIWGTRDRLLLPRQARRAVRVLPRARLEWLPGAGHAPTYDAPDRIARLLLEL